MKSSNISQYDKMTKTPVEPLIVTLSIPTIMSMLITQVYNLVDTAFVGTLGNSASGAVGIVFGFMALLQAIAFMFGQGAGSISSRALGQKNVEEASKTSSTGFFWSFAFALIMAVICFIILDPLVYFLGSTKTIAPYAKIYIGYILAIAPFFVSSLSLNNLLRYEGKAFFGMIGLMTGAILNIFGDWLLIVVLKMGISGAGLSTAISQVVSFVILLWAFLTGKTSAKLKLRYVSFKPNDVLNIMATGFPSMLRQGLNSAATIVLNSVAAVYGDVAVAAFSIVNRISFFTFSLAIGIGQGLQPVAAFNYGAGKYSRVRKAFKSAFIFAEAMMLIVNTIVLVMAGSMIGIFRDDMDVIRIGASALRYQCYSTYLLPYCMVTEMEIGRASCRERV